MLLGHIVLTPERLTESVCMYVSLQSVSLSHYSKSVNLFLIRGKFVGSVFSVGRKQGLSGQNIPLKLNISILCPEYMHSLE